MYGIFPNSADDHSADSALSTFATPDAARVAFERDYDADCFHVAECREDDGEDADATDLYDDGANGGESGAADSEGGE